jgi:hypothetical protein
MIYNVVLQVSLQLQLRSFCNTGDLPFIVCHAPGSVKRNTDDARRTGRFAPYFIHGRGGHRDRKAHSPVRNQSYNDPVGWTMNL